MPTSNDLHEFWASHCQERHLGLRRHCLGQQCLPTARGPEQQCALRNFCTKLKEALWALEKQQITWHWPKVFQREFSRNNTYEGQLMYWHESATVYTTLGKAGIPDGSSVISDGLPALLLVNNCAFDLWCPFNRHQHVDHMHVRSSAEGVPMQCTHLISVALPSGGAFMPIFCWARKLTFR